MTRLIAALPMSKAGSNPPVALNVSRAASSAAILALVSAIRAAKRAAFAFFVAVTKLTLLFEPCLP